MDMGTQKPGLKQKMGTNKKRIFDGAPSKGLLNLVDIKDYIANFLLKQTYVIEQKNT